MPAGSLLVLDGDSRDVTEGYFEIRGGELRTRRPVTPSMLTLNEQVIRQDCLCYLMEKPYEYGWRRRSCPQDTGRAGVGRRLQHRLVG
jgi:hypothetical protein